LQEGRQHTVKLYRSLNATVAQLNNWPFGVNTVELKKGDNCIRHYRRTW